MIIWNVEILDFKTNRWRKIGEHRFDLYDRKRCKQNIRDTRTDLMKILNEPLDPRSPTFGQSWDVSVKVWR